MPIRDNDCEMSGLAVELLMVIIMGRLEVGKKVADGLLAAVLSSNEVREFLELQVMGKWGECIRRVENGIS